ncbi:MAG: class I SAM-dependent methyltransferase [Solirubrobacteraceae bacterium]|nr:class I SAM-dependent methyltransferase [Solirubrobacteraceae bacterium]
MTKPQPAGVSSHGPSILDVSDPWQMNLGERAAIVGLLADLRPSLSIEIGTAEGGSLRQISRFSEQAHSFDLVEPQLDVAELGNVALHTGDSHVLLPELLRVLAEGGENVDFVLVDGDHSAEGVARDMRDLLDSDAVGRTAIVMHDTLNPEVRRGLEAVNYDLWPKVVYVDLDWVAGCVYRAPIEGEMWAGVGLVVCDAERPRSPGTSASQQRYHPHFPIMRRGLEVDGELAALRADLERCQAANRAIQSSASWRLTAPLRRAKAAVAQRIA